MRITFQYEKCDLITTLRALKQVFNVPVMILKSYLENGTEVELHQKIHYIEKLDASGIKYEIEYSKEEREEIEYSHNHFIRQGILDREYKEAEEWRDSLSEKEKGYISILNRWYPPVG